MNRQQEYEEDISQLIYDRDEYTRNELKEAVSALVKKMTVKLVCSECGKVFEN